MHAPFGSLGRGPLAPFWPSGLEQVASSESKDPIQAWFQRFSRSETELVLLELAVGAGWERVVAASAKRVKGVNSILEMI